MVKKSIKTNTEKEFNIRKIALELLRSYEEGGRYVNLLLSVPKVKALPPAAFSQLTSLLYTVVERKLTYDYIMCALSGRGMDKISEYTRDILRLGLCQIIDMSAIPDFAAVNETVALGRNSGERGFINGVLRRAIREKDNLPLPEREKNAARYMSVIYSMPLPLVKFFISLYGEEEAELLIKSFCEKKPLSLTVNREKVSVDKFIELCGGMAKRDRYTELGVVVDEATPVHKLPGYEEGWFFVQDEASRLAVAALRADDGMTVIDLCAAPGGKSFGAALAVGNGGHVYSFDIHESKLSLIESGAQRLGIYDRMTIGVADAAEPIDAIGMSDRIICDVPCSGLGVLAKKPDLKYKDIGTMEELPPLQYSILENAAKHLVTGGILVYSTCTLNPMENSGVTDKFIREHGNFSYVLGDICGIETDCGRLTLLPHKHGTDGFYVAVMRKNYD